LKRWQIATIGLALLLALASCAPRVADRSLGTYKVGTPYNIGGVWYYPKEDPFYDETGIASWYGEDFHGKQTANGELYNMQALTAAHRTLPLPTIVRVTNLENGRSIRLRVNDRGPYARGRIIDVSKRAADLLGFKQNGTARVRVQYEGRGKVADPTQSADIDGSPATSTTTAAPVTSVAATQLAPPPGARASAPVAANVPTAPVAMPSAMEAAWGEPDGTVTSQPVPASTRLWIQVGSFTIRSNAERLATSLSRLGAAQTSQVMLNGKPMFRVRFGPFNAVEEADAMLDRVINAGQNGAQIVVE
jgi:rare lipoprotein A